MRTRSSLIVIVAFLSTSIPVVAELDDERYENWHQWRGPDATGTAVHGRPPLRWDSKTNIKWSKVIPGHGTSTPIIWKDQVFVLSAIKTDRKAETRPEVDARSKTKPPSNFYRFLVLSFERKTGRVVWQRTACERVPHEGHHYSHSYAAASPATDGQFLYVSFGSHGVYCYDLDGNFVWKRDLGRMRTRYGWGEATSPVVYRNSLIINWDHEDQSFITVLDKKTGKTKWKVDRDEPTSWSTPLVLRHNDRDQVIVNATNRVRSYDLSTGKVIWQCGGQTTNVIPSPVASNGVVYCMSFYGKSAALAIPLSARGDVSKTNTILWSYSRGTPYVPSPVLVNDRLYFTLSNGAILSCLDAKTGMPAYERIRLPNVKKLYASPVAADGKIYICDRDGTTVVIKAGLQAEVLATNKLDDSIDASPAIVGKQLFLRGKRLHCIEEAE